MLIDINPILKGDVSEIRVEYPMSIRESADDIVFHEAFTVSAFVKDMAGYITLKLSAQVPYRTVCARCLDSLERSIDVALNKTVISDEVILQTEDTDDYIVSSNGFIDADETLIEQIFLEMPLKHLCKEDCKGLCPKCGADLNQNLCGCSLNDPDPRFDVLRKLLEK